STDRELDHEWTRHLQSGDLMLRLDAPGIQQKGHRGGSDHDNGFKKVFETFRIVGNGARLIPGVDEPVIQIDPDSEELIRSTGNVLPGKTFYRLSVQLKSFGEEAAARLIVRWPGDDGSRI